MKQRRCRIKCGRVLSAVIGVIGIVAGIVILAQLAAVPSFIRGVRWPLSASVGAQLLAFGALALGGALLHPTLMLVAAIPAIGQVIGDYETDSYYPLFLGLAAVLLIFAYVRSKVPMYTLAVVGRVLLPIAVVSAVAGVIAMQAPTMRVTWEIRRAATGRQYWTDILDQDHCPSFVESPAVIDQGCDVIIGTRRATYVLGYSAAAALLGLAGAAGSRNAWKRMAAAEGL